MNEICIIYTAACMSCRIFMLIKIGSSLRILPYWARRRNCSLAVMKAELGTWPNLQFEMYSSSLNWSYEQMFSHMAETEPCRFEILHQECFLSATCPSSKVCMELIFLRCHLHEMLTNFIEVLSEVEFRWRFSKMGVPENHGFQY